jgi:hypothetical protein
VEAFGDRRKIQLGIKGLVPALTPLSPPKPEFSSVVPVPGLGRRLEPELGPEPDQEPVESQMELAPAPELALGLVGLEKTPATDAVPRAGKRNLGHGAGGHTVLTCPLAMNVLKDTYDHSCY